MTTTCRVQAPAGRWLCQAQAARLVGITPPAFRRLAARLGLRGLRQGARSMYREGDAQLAREAHEETLRRMQARKKQAKPSPPSAECPAQAAGERRLRFSAASGCGIPKGCIIPRREWEANPDTGIDKMVAKAKADAHNALTIFTGIKTKKEECTRQETTTRRRRR